MPDAERAAGSDADSMPADSGESHPGPISSVPTTAASSTDAAAASSPARGQREGRAETISPTATAAGVAEASSPMGREIVPGGSSPMSTVDPDPVCGEAGEPGGAGTPPDASSPASSSVRASSASGLLRSTEVSSGVASAMRTLAIRLFASTRTRSVVAWISACFVTMASREDARNAASAFFMSSALA